MRDRSQIGIELVLLYKTDKTLRFAAEKALDTMFLTLKQ